MAETKIRYADHENSVQTEKARPFQPKDRTSYLERMQSEKAARNPDKSGRPDAVREFTLQDAVDCASQLRVDQGRDSLLAYLGKT